MAAHKPFMPYAAGLAIALTLSGALAGCTSQAPTPPIGATTSSTSAGTTTPAAPATPTTTTAPTTTVAPTIEGLPDAAKARTREGANAFVTYYFKMLNEAWTGPRTDILPPFALPTCKTCANYQKTAVDLAAKQQQYRGPVVDLIVVDGTGENKPGDPKYTVIAPFWQLKVDIVDSDGKTVSTEERSKATLFFDLTYDEGWRISEVQVQM